MSSSRSIADYAAAARALMPRGRVWPDEPDSEQAAVLHALARSLQRIDASAVLLRVEAFPATTVRLLPEWEDSLGLPDPCGGDIQSVAQRRAQVVARFTSGGGQSVQHYIDFAASLGFEITIAEYAPSKSGRMRAGEILRSDDWAYAWLVTIVGNTLADSLTLFRAGLSSAGDPLSTSNWTGEVLACELDRIKPAHTILLFA